MAARARGVDRALEAAADDAARAAVLSNRAAASLELGDFAAAVNDCGALARWRRPRRAGGASRTRRATAARWARWRSATWPRRSATTATSDPAGPGGPRSRSADELEAAARAARRQRRRAARKARTRTVAATKDCRVSCIAPTTTERHAFHGAALYASFAAQTHDNRELVVVDTGPAPSPFFTTPGSPGREDNRVIYTHAVHHATIGGKRNVALRLATGDVVAHFDDDDVYAPTYLATMLGAMAAQDAKFVKLSAWFVHDMGSGAWGHFDIDGFDDTTELGARLRLHPNLAKLSSQFLLTYGFSFVYEKSLFPAFTFVDTNWGEDQAILAELNRVGVPVAFHADREGICIHNQHGENCSRSFCHTAVDVAAFTRAGSPLKRGVDEAIPLIRDTLYRGRNAVQPIRQRSDAPCVSHLEGGLFIWETQLALVAGGRDPAADDRAAKESEIPNFKGSYLGRFPLADDAPIRETFRAFETWIYSGNGFSQERYAKLKLERPDPPDRLVGGDDDAGVEAAVGHGLERLRAREGLDHAPGAIVNPDAYRDGGIANPH
ncbi:mitochondrial carrier protein [Aureococcus anophagefferens]|uniref:Mitochondrial carrier protein n=1 Tax=Aureococcus anophagefferens TaxID=44056 RepID=A0ABR1FHB3_AURAN